MPNELEGDSPNTPDPKHVTEEQLGNIVNAAVSSHIKRFTEKQLPALLESALKPITEKLAAPPPPPVVDEDPKAKNKQPDPQIAALTQQLEDMRKSAQAEKDQRLAAEKKQREDRAFSDLKTELAPHVRPDMLEVLANHLFKIQGVVEIDEDAGIPLFKTTHKNFGVEEEVRLPLKDGISQYLKSESAKPFLPSPGTSNTPPVKKNPFAQPPRGNEPIDLSKATPEQKIRAAEEMKQHIQQKLAAAGK